MSERRSPDERSDIRVFMFLLDPAYRYAHAGYLLAIHKLGRPITPSFRGRWEVAFALPDLRF